MKLDYMQCWNGAMAIMASHKEAILAIAGVFLFLPPVIAAQVTGTPPVEGLTDATAIQAAQMAFIEEHWLAILVSNLAVAFGTTALYILFAPSHSGTVGDALSSALKLFVFFLLASLLNGIAVLLGLLLLIIPGLYLIGRLAIVPMFVADQEERNPVAALRKSWEATKDNGFSILLFLMIIFLMGVVTIVVGQLIIGLVVTLATGGAGWPLIENIVGSLLSAGFQILIAAVIASLYITLTNRRVPDVEEVFS